MAEQPFEGVTVLEFGHFIAVPWAGQVLADGGAHVIKIEPLEGEPSRHIAPLGGGESRHFLIRNRGKHSLPLDLRHADARQILDALLARADVVLANMRPGLAAELGLEYEQLAPRYPRIIVGTVTAFGAQGPDAARAGMDHVVQARSGLMVTGGKVQDGLPTSGESPIADYMAASLLAFGVASALYRRERTGRGGRVDTSLLLAALALQNNLMVRVMGSTAPATPPSPTGWARRAAAAYRSPSRWSGCRAIESSHRARSTCAPMRRRTRPSPSPAAARRCAGSSSPPWGTRIPRSPPRC